MLMPVRIASRLGLAVCLTGFLLFSSGCGQKTDPPPAVTPTTEDTAPAASAFTLLEAGADEYNSRPALLLRFSHPLVADQSFDSLILVRDEQGAEISGSWVLDAEDARLLHFPYVQGDRTYALHIKEGLATPDGQTLGALPDREVYSGNLSPVAGFASQGSVLPTRGSQGLPIITVNTPEVDVEFFRVRDKSLSKFLSDFSGTSNRSLWELRNINRLADSVYSNRFALDAAANQRQVSFLPVQNTAELREAGVYFAVMKKAGDFNYDYESTTFYVTDLGLHARTESDGLFTHVAALSSGQPRSGVSVHLQNKKGEILASTTTDSNGDAMLSVRPKSEYVLVARQGSEVALISFNQPALDLAEYPVSGRLQTSQDVYTWSGRNLFRPGEVLQVSALLRDYDGRLLSETQTLYATLRQPDGRAVSTLPLEPEAQAYYSYQRTLGEDVPTGLWSLEYRLDPGAANPLGSFSFRIEEFLPERLKLALDSPAKQLKPGQAFPLNVEAAFLYGAPANGNRFVAETLYRPLIHPIAPLKDWFFGNPDLNLPKEPQEAIDTALDEEGRLLEDIAVLPDSDPPAAPFDVIVSGSVFESGGRAVRRSIIRSVWPADTLVGVRPLFDHDSGPNANSDVRFEIIKANAEGKPVAAENLKIALIRERRDYHWRWVDGSGWNTDYSRRFDTVAESTLNLDGVRNGEFSARVEWGEYRLEVTDPATGLVTRYPFTAGWSWNNDNRGLDARPDKVKVAFEQNGYRAGDTAVLTLTAPYDGPGMILVESDQLLYRNHIQFRGNTTVKIPVDARFMRHDVYVTALVFRPADSASLVGPNRAVGIAHFPVAKDQRNAAMTLQIPDKTRPGDTLSIALSAPELAGQEAWATVEAVDLGIINLTNYPVPDAAAYFLEQRRFGIETHDLYGRIIAPMEGQRARLRYGGDAALSALPQARRPTAKVQTVALHQAPVKFDAQGKATVTLTAPDFNGTLRISALAYSADRYARASEESIVRAPLVMEVSTPRVMAPGDQSFLTVDLHNLSGNAARYQVSATGSPLASIGGATREVSLADNARTTLSFPLEAGNGHGVGKFTVRADSGDTTLERQFEITVRPAWPAVRRSQAQQVQSGTLNFGSNLFDGLMPESANAQISIASIPPLPFTEAITGLIGYPYGCIEQTSSRLWPLVNLDATTSHKFGLEPLEESKRKHMLETGFARIAAMQTENGAFTFWPGEGWVNPQMTAYVADILLTARENGLSIPDSVLEKSLKRLRDDLLTGGDGFYNYDQSAHLRFANNAYSSYVLARSNQAPLGTLRSLWDNQRQNSLTALPLVQLAIALKLAGDEGRAQKAIAEAMKKESSRPDFLGDYGSDFRDEALLLALLYENGLSTAETGARLMQLARELRRPVNARYWFSTQERLALFRLGRAVLQEQHEGLQGEFRIAGKPHALSGRPLVSREVGLPELRQGTSLTLEGDGPFWLSQDIVGYPLQAPKPADNGLRIRRAWYRTDGTLFEGNTLAEGESLIAKITVESEEYLNDLLIVDLLPGGLEIENLALGGNQAFGELVLDGVQLSERFYGTEIRHEEFRDDRYVAAIEIWGGNTAHLFYLVRAVSPGRYVVPPPSAEDMYRPHISNTGTALQTTLTVTPPKKP